MTRLPDIPQTPAEVRASAQDCLNMLDGLQARPNQTRAEAAYYADERTRQERRQRTGSND